MKLILLSLIFVLPFSILSQNLIPNGGFEEFYNCPGRLGDILSSKFWSSPNKGTPDYFNLCNKKGIYSTGYSNAKYNQQPYIGNGYVSFAMTDKTSDSHREAIQCKLKSPLIKGKKYCFKVYVRCDTTRYPESVQFAISKEKLKEENDVVVNYSNIKSIKIGKIPMGQYFAISQIYTSFGDEQYLTVGQLVKDIKYINYISGEEEYGFARGTHLFIDELTLIEVSNESECACSSLLQINIEKGKSIELKNIFFELNSAELKASSFDELNILSEILNKNSNFKAVISGHTDNTGNSDKNKALSEQRAKAVYDYLVKNGISQDRLKFVGYGDTKPLLPNTSEQNKTKNRRVEIVFE